MPMQDAGPQLCILPVCLLVRRGAHSWGRLGEGEGDPMEVCRLGEGEGDPMEVGRRKQAQFHFAVSVVWPEPYPT